MKRYKNMSGNSGILAYEIDNNSITIQFRVGGIYLYNTRRPGGYLLEQMKSLAISGVGLNTFINKYIRKNYDKKLR